MERGALDLDIPEAEIAVDEQGEPVDVFYRPRGRAEKMIEEFMLQANEAVAQFMDTHNHPAVYRVHENPDPEKLRVFAQFARPFGHRIDPSKPQDTRQLQAVLDQAAGDPRQRAPADTATAFACTRALFGGKPGPLRLAGQVLSAFYLTHPAVSRPRHPPHAHACAGRRGL